MKGRSRGRSSESDTTLNPHHLLECRLQIRDGMQYSIQVITDLVAWEVVQNFRCFGCEHPLLLETEMTQCACPCQRKSGTPRPMKATPTLGRN